MNALTMKPRFTLTYEIYTEESCANGDNEYSGFLTADFDAPRERQEIIPGEARPVFTLREVYDFLTSDYPAEHEREGVECDSCPWSPKSPPRWINFSGRWNGDGEALSYALHPDKRGSITGASMCRIARLFGAYGERK